MRCTGAIGRLEYEEYAGHDRWPMASHRDSAKGPSFLEGGTPSSIALQEYDIVFTLDLHLGTGHMVHFLLSTSTLLLPCTVFARRFLWLLANDRREFL